MAPLARRQLVEFGWQRGTITIEGRRFEVPNRYRHLTRLELRFAGWDLALVHLVDEHTGTVLCRLFPQDKTRNASALRRTLEPVTAEPISIKPAVGLQPTSLSCGGMAPLLASLIERRAATGLTPAYLPKDEAEDLWSWHGEREWRVRKAKKSTADAS